MTSVDLIYEAVKNAEFTSHALKKATHDALKALCDDCEVFEYIPSTSSEPYFIALNAVLVDFREQPEEAIDDAFDNEMTADDEDEDDYEFDEDDEEDDEDDDINAAFDGE